MTVWGGGDLHIAKQAERLRSGIVRALGCAAAGVTSMKVRAGGWGEREVGGGGGGTGGQRLDILFGSEQERDEALRVLPTKAGVALPKGLRFVRGRSYAERVAARGGSAHAKRKRAAVRLPQAPVGAQRLVAGHINAHGLRGSKAQELGEVFDRTSLDILAVTETNLRTLARGPRVAGTWWVGRNCGGALPGKEGHGVGFMVGREIRMGVSVLEESAHPDALWIKVSKGTPMSKGRSGWKLANDLFVCAFYLAPDSSLPAASMHGALKELKQRIVKYQEQGGTVVVLGDLNAKFAATTATNIEIKNQYDEKSREMRPLSTVCGPHAQAPQPKARGKAVACMLRSTGMFSLHGQRAGANEVTWKGGKFGPTLTDYIVVPKTLMQTPHKLVIRPDIDIHSDHFLVYTKLDTLVRRAAAGAGSEGGQRRGVSALWGSVAALREKREQYVKEIDAAFAGYRVDAQASPSDAWAQFIACLRQASEAVLGACNAAGEARRKRRRPEWLDGEVRGSIQKRRALWAKLRKAGTRGDAALVAAATRRYEQQAQAAAKLVLRKKALWWRGVQEEMNGMRTSDARAFWRQVRRYCPGKRQRGFLGPVRDRRTGGLVFAGAEYTAVWAEHFRALGNEQGELRAGALEARDVDGAYPLLELGKSALEDPITDEEVSAALRVMRAGKAPGPDGVRPEFLKWAGPKIVAPLRQLFNRVYSRESIPAEWQRGNIVPLFKKGDPADLGNYRGITLLSVPGKLFSRIVQMRLSEHLESGKLLSISQNGFRAKRGCAENLLTFTEALRESNATGGGALVCFLDFQKAFDRVWREGLWAKLRGKEVKGRLGRMLKALYAVHQAQVLVTGEVSAPFDIAIGTKQGCTLSPTLFAVFIDDLAERLEEKAQGLPLPLTKHMLTELLLADDVALFAPSANALQQLLDVCTEWADKWHMNFGIAKCGVLLPREGDGSLKVPHGLPTFKLQGQSVPFVETYRYLGLVTRADVSWRETIADRVRATRASVAEIRDLLTMPHVSIASKMHVVQSCVMSTALYGSEVWCSSEATMRAVEKEVAVAVRLACGTSARGNARALLAENGMLPLYLQVVSRRLALLAKWQAAGASEWPARIMKRGKRGLGGEQTWGSKTASMARAVGWRADGNQTLRTALLEAARAQLLKEGPHCTVRAEYARRFLDAGTLEGQQYIKEGASCDQLGARMLIRMRTGCVALPKYLLAAGSVASDKCVFCRNRRGVAEGRTHLLLECPAWREERDAWARAREALFAAQEKRAYARVWSALGEEGRVTLMLGGRVPDAAGAGVAALGTVRGKQRQLQGLACSGLGAMFRARVKAAAARGGF